MLCLEDPVCHFCRKHVCLVISCGLLPLVSGFQWSTISWKLLLCHFVHYAIGHTIDKVVHPKFHRCLSSLVQQRSLESVL